MTIAFHYRPRKRKIGQIAVEVGKSVSFDEQVEYVLLFPNRATPQLVQRLTELGGDMIGEDIGVLSFGNFVGRAELAGATINVISTKIGEGGVSRVLEEISELGSSLVFGWRTPTSFEATSSFEKRSPVPYHQFQFLRRIMMGAKPGDRLQDWLGEVERSPTRRFEQERPIVSPARLRRLDYRAVRSIFTRIDRLVPVPANAAIAANGLAQALAFGTPPQLHFPALVAAPRGRLSFDTIENRFVKHVLQECLVLVHRFVDNPKLHASLRSDCRQMLTILDQVASADFFLEVGFLSGFQAPSQALAKAEGYREIFVFWNDLSRHISLPRSTEETNRLLEGRNVALLYEYWVFLKVLEATCVATNAKPTAPPAIRHDELGESIIVGLPSAVGPDVTVTFNPTYMRSSKNAYSTPLRPDVIVECNGRRHAFDAKYRLDRFDIEDGDADDGAATYKRADLYKMHTYRDAIADLQTAFVVYPGSEFVFFDRSGNKYSSPRALGQPDGVGAVPLRPSDDGPSGQLRTLVQALIMPPPSTSLS